jgi:integrase
MGGNNSAKSSVSVSVRQAFNLFIEERHLGTRSVEKYRTLMNHLAALGLDGCPIDSLDIQPIYRHFNTANSPRTAKDYLIALNAVLQHSGIKNNRLGDAINAIKLCPKQPPKPFTQDEVQAILGAFSRLFPHYYNYVLFRFSTGMRTAEINGLQWQHVADDCSQIWVGTSLRRNIRKATKTNKARIIPCNQTLQTLLLEIKPSDWAPLDLVFVTSRGHAIHDNAFATQHWQPSLLLAGVDYRKPYLTRHTFITRCLESGMPPTVLASIVGHDIQTMFQHYVGHTITAKIPELF